MNLKKLNIFFFILFSKTNEFSTFAKSKTAPPPIAIIKFGLKFFIIFIKDKSSSISGSFFFLKNIRVFFSGVILSIIIFAFDVKKDVDPATINIFLYFLNKKKNKKIPFKS